MRKSHLVSLEVFSSLEEGEFFTEPHEAGWASALIVFVYLESVRPGSSLDLRVQISADGQRWIDTDCMFPTMTDSGGYSLRYQEFGTWVRLAGRVKDDRAELGEAMEMHLYLDLKE